MTPLQLIIAIYVLVSLAQFACLLWLLADNDRLKDQNARLRQALANRKNYPRYLLDDPADQP